MIDQFACGADGCPYKGDGIDITYDKGGDVKTVTCPLCFSKWGYSPPNLWTQNGGGFKREPFIATAFYGLGVMFAIGGVWYAFWEGSNTIVKAGTICCGALALFGYLRKERVERWNRMIQNRIDEYNETGIRPLSPGETGNADQILQLIASHVAEGRVTSEQLKKERKGLASDSPMAKAIDIFFGGSINKPENR